MTETVKVVVGGQIARFPWNLPGQATSNSTTTAINSAPIPKDATHSTFLAYVTSTAGATSATVGIWATDDPHTAGADDPILGTRNNFAIGTTNTSTTITSAEGLFRADMDTDEVYAVGVPAGSTMTYVSPTSATLSAAATATATVPARFQATYWVLLATITLSGTRRAADGFATEANWKWVRAVVSAIAGTNSAVHVKQGS